MRKGTLRQILLITDGCSNKGEDPASVAALCYEQGITVNVIGILDDINQRMWKDYRKWRRLPVPAAVSVKSFIPRI